MDQKDCEFDPWSQHTPRLQVQTPGAGVWEAINQCFSLTSLSLSITHTHIKKYILG